jgi:hypothetical protein
MDTRGGRLWIGALALVPVVALALASDMWGGPLANRTGWFAVLAVVAVFGAISWDARRRKRRVQV